MSGKIVLGKKSILVSAVGGDIGFSVARAVGGQKFKIIGCDIREVLLPVGVVDRFVKISAATNAKQYLRALEKLFKKERVAFFIPTCEPEIRVLNANRPWLEAVGVKTLIQSPKVLDVFLDKLNTVRYLHQLGVKAPQTVLLRDYKGEFGFPLIVKPRQGSGGSRNWKVDHPVDLKYLREKNDGSLLAQQCVGRADQEYTTGIFSDGEKISSITFKRRLGPGGLSVEVELVEEPFLEKLSVSIAQSVHLVGSINLQTRRVGKEFIPFEINPRLSSTLLFRKKFGFDDCVWWMKILFGQKYTYKKEYTSGRALRSWSESYFEMKRKI